MFIGSGFVLRSHKPFSVCCSVAIDSFISRLETDTFVFLSSGTKTVQFSVKTFSFGVHLICSREKNSGRASSPPMLKIG